jgi:small subunit ribosomal protein S16
MYKIVAADSRASRTGKYIESIGQYNPLLHPMVIDVNEERLYAWLKRGAVPSDTTRSLLQRKGLWLKWGLMKKGADDAAIAAAMEKWQAQQGEKQEREAARKVRRKAARRKKAAAGAAEPAQPAPAAEPAPAPAAAAAAEPAA